MSIYYFQVLCDLHEMTYLNLPKALAQDLLYPHFSDEKREAEIACFICPWRWAKHSIISGGDEISSRFSGSRVCAHCSAMSLSITAAADQEMSMKTRAESLTSTDGKHEPAGRKKRPMVIGSRVWEKRLKLRLDSRVA